MRRRRNSSGGKPASSAQTRSWATRSSDRGMVIDVIAGTTRERSRMPRTTPFYRRRDWLGIARRTRLSGQARTARHFLALGFLCRTRAISGSRPWTFHRDRFYRESAALRCSACGLRASAKPLDDPAVCDGLHSDLLIERHRLWCRKQQQH